MILTAFQLILGYFCKDATESRSVHIPFYIFCEAVS